jgi:adenylate cyclase
MRRLLSELQRRKVLRVASAFVIAGWIILQVALALQTALKLPEAFSAIVVALLIIGFPIAIVVSWFFEFTE